MAGKQNKHRKDLLRKLRFLKAVENMNWDIFSTELQAGEQKEHLDIWRRGFLYALDEMRKIK